MNTLAVHFKVFMVCLEGERPQRTHTNTQLKSQLNDCMYLFLNLLYFFVTKEIKIEVVDLKKQIHRVNKLSQLQRGNNIRRLYVEHQGSQRRTDTRRRRTSIGLNWENSCAASHCEAPDGWSIYSPLCS